MIQPIPITTPLDKNIDEVGLTSYGAARINGFVDNAGWNRFPGLEVFVNLGTDGPIDGLFWWGKQNKVVAVSKGKTFTVDDSLGTFTDITDSTFELGKRVSFAEVGTALFGANGAKISKIPSTGKTAYLTDADAPTTVSHVAALDSYLLANEVGTQRFHFSSVTDPEVWNGEFASSEALPDNLQAVAVANARLYLFGSDSTEVWRNDGESPFVREYQGYIQRGTLAKNSVTWGDGTFYWLDDTRQIVRLSGTQAEPLSLSINKYLQGFGTVSDAIGDYMLVDGKPFIVFHFPTEGKTLCLDLIPREDGYHWAELGNWNSSTASFDRWAGNCYCLAKGWNFALVGDRTTGIIYKISGNFFDNAGSTLRTVNRTGHIDRGTTSRWKHSNALTFRLKRSQSQNPTGSLATALLTEEGDPLLLSDGETYLATQDPSSEAALIVKWRDNGKTEWGNERIIPLTSLYGTDFIVRRTRLGRYRTRQYEFTLTDSAPLVLVSVEEEFDYA